MKSIIQFVSILMVVCSVSSSLFAGGPSTGHYFFIQSKNSGSYVSNESNRNPGSPVVQRASQNDAQRWRFVYAGNGYYYILSKNTGLFLQASNSSRSAKALIVQNSLNESSAQKWKLESVGDGYYLIQNKGSGMYLDVQWARKADGTPIWQYPLNKSNAQIWKLLNAGKVFNVNQAVSAAMFSNAKKRLFILGHHFNFGENLYGVSSLRIIEKGRNKIVEGIFSRNKKSSFDDIYFFTITINPSGELIKFGKGTISRVQIIGEGENFLSLREKNDWVQYKLIGKIPLTGGQILPSDNYLGSMEQRAKKRNSRMDWEEAADEIALIMAVAILNQRKNTAGESTAFSTKPSSKNRLEGFKSIKMVPDGTSNTAAASPKKGTSSRANTQKTKKALEEAFRRRAELNRRLEGIINN